MQLHTLTINKAREGLKNKDFSSIELTKSCLEQIKKRNPALNAFITVCEEGALELAKKADKVIVQHAQQGRSLTQGPTLVIVGSHF